MKYFTMKMKEGKNGTQTPEDIRAFLQSKKILAIGAPEYTTGSGTFLNTIKPGDVVILREPAALLKVLSDATPYQPDGQFPDFDSWLCWGRKVEILSWYEDDKDWLGIPKFSGTGYLSTCAAVNEKNNLALAQKWLQLVQEKTLSFFTMKMKEGKNGTQSPDDIRTFLQSKKILAIGDPEYTTGAGTFLNTIKPGDVVILREPAALLKVLSDATPYQPDGQFPNFDSWLCWGRKVEILSWYADDKDWLGIPKFSGSGYLSTCAAVNEENNLALAQKWLHLAQEKTTPVT